MVYLIAGKMLLLLGLSKEMNDKIEVSDTLFSAPRSSAEFWFNPFN